MVTIASNAKVPLEFKAEAVTDPNANWRVLSTVPVASPNLGMSCRARFGFANVT